MSTWLVTGAAGFIGHHVTRRLLDDGHTVVAVDNFDGYGDPALKRARVTALGHSPGLVLRTADICDPGSLDALVAEFRPPVVVNLAARAGVRHSLEDPRAYAHGNVVGFTNVLEACRKGHVGHLLYASSSSVYGAGGRMPFSVHDGVDHPVSPYAATKRANELLAHTYSHVYGLPTTSLRLFAVYGPWGRPDMAYFSFAEAIAAGRPVRVFGDGGASRDFTYIDDVVECVVRAAATPARGDPAWSAQTRDPATSRAPYRLLNVGTGETVSVGELIRTLERLLGRRADIVREPARDGDVPATRADVEDLRRHTGFTPRVPFAEGMARFVDWLVDDYPRAVATRGPPRATGGTGLG
ncbi:NAD-dependent epimerase [soil metagenome]